MSAVNQRQDDLKRAVFKRVCVSSKLDLLINQINKTLIKKEIEVTYTI
jgi:hypothetical protein